MSIKLPNFNNPNLPIKALAGVYFLFSGNKVVYVGQSINVFSRVYTHVRDKEFDSFNFIICDVSLLNDIEAMYIMRLQPKYNHFLPINNIWATHKQLKDKFGINKREINKKIQDENLEIKIFNGDIYIRLQKDFDEVQNGNS